MFGCSIFVHYKEGYNMKNFIRYLNTGGFYEYEFFLS